MTRTTTGGTATTHANVVEMAASFVAANPALAARPHDLGIEVRVVDVRTVRLIPHSILAAEILHNLMLPLVSVRLRGMPKPDENPYARMEYLELTADVSRPVLSSDGRTEYTGMSLSRDEYRIAKAAVEAVERWLRGEEGRSVVSNADESVSAVVAVRCGPDVQRIPIASGDSLVALGREPLATEADDVERLKEEATKLRRACRDGLVAGRLRVDDAQSAFGYNSMEFAEARAAWHAVIKAMQDVLGDPVVAGWLREAVDASAAHLRAAIDAARAQEARDA